MTLIKRRHPTLLTEAGTGTAPTAPRYELMLVSGVPLPIGAPHERRKHLAIVGERAWVDYWMADLLAHTKQDGLRSAVITSSEDTALQTLPRALDLPPEQCSIRRVIHPETDPGLLRQRVSDFLKTVDDPRPTLIFMGSHLGHAWPFLLGRQPETDQKNMLVIADLSQQLRLPLAQAFRYFLVQDTYRTPFENAAERWHRHEAVKPKYRQTHLYKERGILFQS